MEKKCQNILNESENHQDKNNLSTSDSQLHNNCYISSNSLTMKFILI